MNNKKILLSIVFMFVFLFTSLLPNKAYAETSISYVNEEVELLTMSQKDEIKGYGEQLSAKGLNLIFETRIQNNKNGNEECKDIFYSYIKKSQSNNKVIVAIYYTDKKEFEFYDDYGVLTKNTLDEVFNYIKKFDSNDKLDEGIIFSYKVLSKELNKKLDLNIESIKNLNVENPYRHSIFSIKNFTGILIVLVLLIGFRRNKNMNIN